MISRVEIQETNRMIAEENLDVRTITMGISLIDCADPDINKFNENIYKKITTYAKDLVKVGDEIAKHFGIPVVNKRISVTPIAIAAAGCKTDSYVSIAKTLDKAAEACGVNFIGGFSALVQKGCTPSDRILLDSIPEALAVTERVCSSVNIGTSRNGLNMNAVKKMGEIIKETAELTKDRDSIGCAKFVVFCNAVEDNPFMAGAFHGVGEADCVINVGVSGPGVVKKGGVMASSYVGGLSGAFIPVSEDHAMIEAAELGALTLEKLEAMTCVCSVGLDMIAIPGNTSAATISGIIADEAAIGMVNNKTTAARLIPVVGKDVGDQVEFGGLLGYAPIMAVNKFSCEKFVNRGGRVPAPIHSFKN